MDRGIRLILVLLLPVVFFACAKPEGEDFGLRYGIGMKLDPNKIEKALKKIDKNASRFPGFEEMPPAETPGLDINAHMFIVSGAWVSFLADNKEKVQAVIVMPSWAEMMPELMGAGMNSPSEEDFLNFMLKSAKKARAESWRIRSEKGITLGSTDADVEKAYGKPALPTPEYKGMKSFIYSVNGYELSFLFQNGVLTMMACSKPGFAMEQGQEFFRKHAGLK